MTDKEDGTKNLDKEPLDDEALEKYGILNNLCIKTINLDSKPETSLSTYICAYMNVFWTLSDSLLKS